MRALRLLLLCACALAASVQAETFRGIVSHVTDGDTLWVRPASGGAPIEIRLHGIDAPEGCQAFGPQAKRALAARVLRQPVVVRTRGQDDFHRTLAQVRHRGQDVGGWLVREGHAWSNGFGRKPGPYAREEDQARKARRGLWVAPRPQEPRNFRRSHGRCQ